MSILRISHRARALSTAGFLVSIAFLCLACLAAPARADEDLALNRPASASCSQGLDHSPSKANDGKGDTRWCASGEEVPQWWEVDLQNLADLTGIQIKWEMNGCDYLYTVDGSADGKTWKVLSDQSETTSTHQVQKLKFQAKGIRYVRISISGVDDGSWASIFDVNVFGTWEPGAFVPAPAVPTDTGVGAPSPDVNNGSAPRPPRVFGHPDRIRYDGHCLTIEGKDVLIFSGAFHYFRCPKELWADRFQKIKDAHFNAVETYVPWNWCEQVAPKDTGDFSQVNLADLRDWLKMAQEQFHLHTIVRPGPYICAEWANGGYPRWLVNLKTGSGLFLRTDNPLYLAWSKHWYDAVCKVVAPEQITHKAPGEAGVILFQIENEYDFAHIPSFNKMGQLRALYQDAVADGIDVPIFTCWTHEIRRSNDPSLSQVFDAVNLYPRHNMKEPDEKLGYDQKDQPDAPEMVSELQGGWFSNVGGKLSEKQDGIEPEQENAITLTCLRDGMTIGNYYMLFGGTNFGGWAARNITTTYDYGCPIRECGGVDEKYRVVQAIGEMLQAWGPELARSKIVPCRSDSNNAVVFTVRQAADGALFVFASRDFDASPQSGQAALRLNDGRALNVNYDLRTSTFRVARLAPGAADVAVNTWLPRVIPAPVRPAVPDKVLISGVLARADQGELDWKPLVDKETLLPHGEEPHYLFYRATPALSAEQATELHTLHLDLYSPDQVVLQINGNVLTATTNKRKAVDAEIGKFLRAGDNEIIVLYDDQGTYNGGPGIETPAGIKDGRLGTSGSAANSLPLAWSLADRIAGDRQKWWAGTVAADGWTPTRLDAADKPAQSNALVTWYRADFELPAQQPHVWVPWKATVAIDGDAYLYLNGHELGRYWDSGPQFDYFLPECWLNFGAGKTNNLTIVVRPTAKGAGVGNIEVSPYAQYAEQR